MLWPWPLTYDLEKFIRSGHYHYQCVYQIWEQSIPWFLSYRVNTIAGGGRLRRKTITSHDPSDRRDIITCLGLTIIDRERTTSLSKAAWAMQMMQDVSMCHTKILWLRRHLQEIGTTWNHPHNGLHPGTRVSKEWNICLRHIWDPSRPSTEVLQKHQDITTPEYPDRPCIIIPGDLHCKPDKCIDAPSWIGSGLLQGSSRLWHKVSPFSICLTEDFPISNAIHTLLWPVYSPSSTPPSIGKGPYWFPIGLTHLQKPCCSYAW